MVAIALVHTCKHLRPVEGYRIESPTAFQSLLPAFVSWESYDAWALVSLSVNSGKAVPACEGILGLNLVIHVKPRTPWLHMCKGGLLCKLGVCPMGKIQADSAIFHFHICKLKQLHTSASASRVTAVSAHPDHICAMTTTVSLTGTAGYSQLWAPVWSHVFLLLARNQDSLGQNLHDQPFCMWLMQPLALSHGVWVKG